MKKYRKWLSICLVFCVAAGIMGGCWYRQKVIEERKLSLIYIPKVVDGTNDFWKALILGAKIMQILKSRHRLKRMMWKDRISF